MDEILFIEPFYCHFRAAKLLGMTSKQLDMLQKNGVIQCDRRHKQRYYSAEVLKRYRAEQKHLRSEECL